MPVSLVTKQTITLFLILSLLSSVLSVALTPEQNYTLFGEKTKESKPKETKSESKPKDEDKSKDNDNNKESNTDDKDSSDSGQQHEILDKHLKMGEVMINCAQGFILNNDKKCVKDDQNKITCPPGFKLNKDKICNKEVFVNVNVKKHTTDSESKSNNVQSQQ